MAPTLITNVAMFDGTGAAPFPGEVLVERQPHRGGGARAANAFAAAGAAVVDGGGATLIPGLIEAHAHLGFGSSVDRVLRGRTPLAGADAPDHGAYRQGHARSRLHRRLFRRIRTAPPAETALRDEIAAGWLPGPRLRACSFEREAGSVMDGTRKYVSFERRSPDVDGVRTFVNEMAEIGVDFCQAGPDRRQQHRAGHVAHLPLS